MGVRHSGTQVRGVGSGCAATIEEFTDAGVPVGATRFTSSSPPPWLAAHDSCPGGEGCATDMLFLGRSSCSYGVSSSGSNPLRFGAWFLTTSRTPAPHDQCLNSSLASRSPSCGCLHLGVLQPATIQLQRREQYLVPAYQRGDPA